MIVARYDRSAARTLAAAIVAGAASPLTRGGGAAGTRVIDVGGGLHLGTWREQLRRRTDQNNVAALTLRTGPRERQLSDADWARVAGGLIAHVGLTERPWAAVRTSATTVTLLTDAAGGPVSRTAALDYARQVTVQLRRPAADQPATSTGPHSVEAADQQAGPEAVAPYAVAQLSFATPADPAPDASATTPPPPTALAAAATQAAGRARGGSRHGAR